MKYQRKPVYSFLEDLPKPKVTKRPMPCLGMGGKDCLRVFKTDQANRVCTYCSRKEPGVKDEL